MAAEQADENSAEHAAEGRAETIVLATVVARSGNDTNDNNPGITLTYNSHVDTTNVMGGAESIALHAM